MARPWKTQWPYVAKSGRKSYRIGFRDHEGALRTKAFPSAKSANEWMQDYIAAERRGAHSLRRFLLDLDAKDASGDSTGRTIGEVIQIYFAFNAPETADGLARSTFRAYGHSASRHLLGNPGMERGKPHPPAEHAVRFAARPASAFNEPDAPRALREAMRHANVGSSARAHAWRVLSAALSWAASSERVPEITSNGCLLANEKISNRRKSMRSNRGRHSTRRHGNEVGSWALSPRAAELIRAKMLASTLHRRRPLLMHRDAMIVSLQFGLALRNQEVYGTRWMSLESSKRVRITDVLGLNELDDRAKTEVATDRRIWVPSLLYEDLTFWRAMLVADGYPARDVDFVIPGDLTGPHNGIREPDTGACHMSSNQAQQWRARCMKRILEEVARSHPAFANVIDATPYSLRRGGISARLRAENAQSVAEQCGTSLEMLSQHYSYDIEDLEQTGPQPLDQQLRAARAATLAEQSNADQLQQAA
jgi:hypothetical protein